jgi:hypothetical protein
VKLNYFVKAFVDGENRLRVVSLHPEVFACSCVCVFVLLIVCCFCFFSGCFRKSLCSSCLKRPLLSPLSIWDRLATRAPRKKRKEKQRKQRSFCNRYVCVGTKSGLLLRSHLDSSSGALSDTRSRFLGLRPVRLAVVRCPSGGALLALGERAWLLFAPSGAGTAGTGSLLTAPLACPALQHAASFASAADPAGWAALQGDSLKVISVTVRRKKKKNRKQKKM